MDFKNSPILRICFVGIAFLCTLLLAKQSFVHLKGKSGELRGGGSCEFPQSSDTCEKCHNDFGFYAKCDSTPNDTVCTPVTGSCMVCSQVTNPLCPGISYSASSIVGVINAGLDDSRPEIPMILRDLVLCCALAIAPF